MPVPCRGAATWVLHTSICSDGLVLSTASHITAGGVARWRSCSLQAGRGLAQVTPALTSRESQAPVSVGTEPHALDHTPLAVLLGGSQLWAACCLGTLDL